MKTEEIKIDNIVKDNVFSYQNWLNTLSKKIEGISTIALLLLKDKDYQLAAILPENQNIPTEFIELIEKVTTTKSGVVIPKGNEKTTGFLKFLLAYPVLVNEQVKAIVLLGLIVEDQKILPPILSLIERHAELLKSEWVDIELNSHEQNNTYLSDNIDLLSKVLSELHFDSSVMSFVTEISLLFQCQRVSLGIKKNNAIKLLYFAHSSKISKRMNIVRLLEEAMNEAADQQRLITQPEFSDNTTDIKTISIEHQQLINKEEFSNSILSIPLYNTQKEIFAVVTLERDKPFLKQEGFRIESLSALSAIILYEKKANDRWIGLKVFDSLKTQLIRLLGKHYIGRKLLVIFLALLLLAMQTITAEYRLASKIEIVAIEQRAIVAPFEGYIKSANYRLGDAIKEGTLLVQLDDKDLRLDKIRLGSQIVKLQKQKEKAIAKNEKASVNIANAQIEETRIEQQLVQMNIERSSIRSSITGLIIQGDLSQRLGANVNKGELLFELAPNHHYKLNLKIPENRIKDIKIGLSGYLYLSALPKEVFSFEINKILPNLVTDDEGAFFIAEAILKDSVDIQKISLGLRGVGKILIDERLLISIWTRELIEFIRLQGWIWWG